MMRSNSYVKGNNRTGAIIIDDGSRFFVDTLAMEVFQEPFSYRVNIDLRQLESWKSTTAIGQLNDG